jgi:GNAT superfamily N-acetyltransferase
MYEGDEEGMKIQSLSLSDVEMLGQLWRLQHVAYRLEAEIIGFQEIPPLMDTMETLQNCGENFYGYLDTDGELLGAVAVDEEEINTLTVTRMMVHPEHFRKGIAAALMTHVFEQHPDLPRYIVSTGTLNQPAVQLYTKFGFKPVEVVQIAPGVELTTFHKNKD